jgi:hypothetical protein
MVPRMIADKWSTPGAPADDERLDDALKKTPGQPKTAPRNGKEARLGAALRENLRRRKASRRKESGRKDKD